MSPSLIPDDGLDAALRLFWRQGYFDTSMDSLVTASGLNRKAIYTEYGGKEALFAAILQRYQDTIMAQNLAPLRVERAGLAALQQFWGQFAERPDGPETRLGCLMVNTATEVAPHVKRVERIVKAYLADVRALLHSALTQAKREGHLRRGTDVDAVADFMVGALLGLMTLARSPVPRDAVRHYVAGIIAYLDTLTPE